MFAIFEGHLQKVLVWKENPDEFIQESIDQDTKDTLHEVIKEKMDSVTNQRSFITSGSVTNSNDESMCSAI